MTGDITFGFTHSEPSLYLIVADDFNWCGFERYRDGGHRLPIGVFLTELHRM